MDNHFSFSSPTSALRSCDVNTQKTVGLSKPTRSGSVETVSCNHPAPLSEVTSKITRQWNFGIWWPNCCHFSYHSPESPSQICKAIDELITVQTMQKALSFVCLVIVGLESSASCAWTNAGSYSSFPATRLYWVYSFVTSCAQWHCAPCQRTTPFFNRKQSVRDPAISATRDFTNTWKAMLNRNSHRQNANGYHIIILHILKRPPVCGWGGLWILLTSSQNSSKNGCIYLAHRRNLLATAWNMELRGEMACPKWLTMISYTIIKYY